VLHPIFRKIRTEDKRSTETGYENENKIESYFSQYLVQDETAKNDRVKSDIVIEVPGHQDPIGIEVKTTLDTEFGQLTVGYDTERERWVIHNSSFNKGKSEENKKYMDRFFVKYLQPFLKELKPPTGMSNILKKRGEREQIVVGLYKEPGHKKALEAMQDSWFGDGKEHRIELSPAILQKYYSTKGDDLIQINGLGLYKLSDRFDLDIPYFSELVFRADAKFHIKNHGDSFTFNIAFRADDLDKEKSKLSKLDISKKQDAERLVKII
jgi:hypothetical protein